MIGDDQSSQGQEPNSFGRERVNQAGADDVLFGGDLAEIWGWWIFVEMRARCLWLTQGVWKTRRSPEVDDDGEGESKEDEEEEEVK